MATSPPLQSSITLRSPATRAALVQDLNQRLADLGEFHRMVDFAHWNVQGDPAFFTVHRLFNSLGKSLGKATHAIAGRIVTLGGQAAGCLAPGATYHIPDYPLTTNGLVDHLREVSTRLAIMIGLLRMSRDFAKDKDERQTSHTLGCIMTKLEKKGRRLLNSMPSDARTAAMNAAAAALGGVQNAAGGKRRSRSGAPQSGTTAAGGK